MTRRKIVLYRIGTLLCLAGAVAVLASTGLGASTPYLRTLGFGYGDAIYNYDFTSQSRLVVGRRLGDSLLFYNNAEIDKVKNIAERQVLVLRVEDEFPAQRLRRLGVGPGRRQEDRHAELPRQHAALTGSTRRPRSTTSTTRTSATTSSEPRTTTTTSSATPGSTTARARSTTSPTSSRARATPRATTTRGSTTSSTETRATITGATMGTPPTSESRECALEVSRPRLPASCWQPRPARRPQHPLRSRSAIVPASGPSRRLGTHAAVRISEPTTRVVARYRLSPGTRQGVPLWYTIRLHARFRFARRPGECILSAATNGLTAAQIIVKTDRRAAQVSSVGWIQGRRLSRLSAKTARIDFRNYLQTRGPRPGPNTLTVTLDVLRGRCFDSLSVLPDSGIGATTVRPDELRLLVPQQPIVATAGRRTEASVRASATRRAARRRARRQAATAGRIQSGRRDGLALPADRPRRLGRVRVRPEDDRTLRPVSRRAAALQPADGGSSRSTS